MANDPGAGFEFYEDLASSAFDGATAALSAALGGAEVSLIAATVAPQTVDGLVSVLPEPVVRAVVFVEGESGLDDLPYLLAVSTDDARALAAVVRGEAPDAGAELDAAHLTTVGELLGHVADSLAKDLSQRLGRSLHSEVRDVSALALLEEQSSLEDLAAGGPIGLVSASYLCAERVVSFSQIISADYAEFISDHVAPATGDATPRASEPAGSASDLSLDELNAILSGPPPPDLGAPAARPAPPASRPSAPPPRPAGGAEVRSARFEELPSGQPPSDGVDNFPLVADIPIQLSVELGRTHRTIREILEFGQGYTIRLDKAADEPVDICAGGRVIARGEVVVIDENFAVRIRQIVRPAGSWINEERTG